MYTAYNNLPDNSRVWIYQANREFSKREIDFVSEKATEFIGQWTRHGDNLKGSFTINYSQFLVIAVDEGFANVSGCSIDASVRFVQQIESQLNIDLMNKMNISFRDGEHINIVKLPEFKQYVNEGKISSKTIVFNNMVQTKKEIENNWEVPADQSWHKRFLKQ